MCAAFLADGCSVLAVARLAVGRERRRARRRGERRRARQKPGGEQARRCGAPQAGADSARGSHLPPPSARCNHPISPFLDMKPRALAVAQRRSRGRAAATSSLRGSSCWPVAYYCRCRDGQSPPRAHDVSCESLPGAVSCTASRAAVSPPSSGVRRYKLRPLGRLRVALAGDAYLLCALRSQLARCRLGLRMHALRAL